MKSYTLYKIIDKKLQFFNNSHLFKLFFGKSLGSAMTSLHQLNWVRASFLLSSKKDTQHTGGGEDRRYRV